MLPHTEYTYFKKVREKTLWEDDVHFLYFDRNERRSLSNRTEPLDKGDLGAALLLVLRDEVDSVEGLQGQLVH